MQKIKHYFQKSNVTVEVDNVEQLKVIAASLGETLKVKKTVFVPGKGITTISTLSSIDIMKTIHYRVNEIINHITQLALDKFIYDTPDDECANFFLDEYTNNISSDDTLIDLFEELGKRAENVEDAPVKIDDDTNKKINRMMR